jgi:hypothetical protein
MFDSALCLVWGFGINDAEYSDFVSRRQLMAYSEIVILFSK